MSSAPADDASRSTRGFRAYWALVALIVGLGPLEPLLNDPEIDEIMVNGPFQIFSGKAFLGINLPDFFSFFCTSSFPGLSGNRVRREFAMEKTSSCA